MVAAALAAAGPIIQGIGAYTAGKKTKQAAYAQALEEERAGVAEIARLRDSARVAIGEQVAAQFSNGMQGGSGSALDALAESQINASLDAMTIRRDKAMTARAQRAQGDQAMSEGKFALVNGIIGAANAVKGQQSDWAAAQKGKVGAALAAGGAG